LKLKVHTQILIAIVLGVVAGIVLGGKTTHIKIVGDMFILDAHPAVSSACVSMVCL